MEGRSSTTELRPPTAHPIIVHCNVLLHAPCTMDCLNRADVVPVPVWRWSETLHTIRSRFGLPPAVTWKCGRRRCDHPDQSGLLGIDVVEVDQDGMSRPWQRTSQSPEDCTGPGAGRSVTGHACNAAEIARCTRCTGQKSAPTACRNIWNGPWPTKKGKATHVGRNSTQLTQTV